MKKIVLIAVLSLSLVSCAKDGTRTEVNQPGRV